MYNVCLHLDYCLIIKYTSYRSQNGDVNDVFHVILLSTYATHILTLIHLWQTNRRSRNSFPAWTERTSWRMKFIKRRVITFLNLNCIFQHFYLSKEYDVKCSTVLERTRSIHKFYSWDALSRNAFNIKRTRNKKLSICESCRRVFFFN